MAHINNFKVDRDRNSKSVNLLKKGRNFNKDSENLTKTEKLMNGINLWASFYRSNVHRFVKDYLGIELKLFQKILIYLMMNYSYFMYLASRGK